jgi:hypothetical protein
MRKIVLLFLLLCMAVPAMAASNVTITCTKTVVVDTNWVTVSWASDHNRIRAFGLDIKAYGPDGNTSDPNMIMDVCDVNSNYRIYPGEISIVNGDVNAYNKPWDPCDLADHNGVLAVEMGSLYTTDSNYAGDANAGYNKIPALTGTLLRFAYKKACGYRIDANQLRGGIVMEDPCEILTLSSPLFDSNGCITGCTVPDTTGMTQTAACTALQAVVPPFVCGNVTQEVNCTVANGLVLRTNPAAGLVVTCGSTVDMVLSQHPAAPGAASNPTPAAGTACVGTGTTSLSATLSWAVGSDTNTQDIYFGTSNPPPLVVSGAPVSQTTYAASGMNVYTLYRWRVNEKNVCGVVTTGTVYCFTTGAQTGKPCCNNEAHVCLGDVNTVAPYTMTTDGRGGDNFTRASDVTALTAFIGTLGSSHRCTTVLHSGTCPPCYDFDGDGFVRASDVTALTGRVTNNFGASHRHSCPYVSCSNP